MARRGSAPTVSPPPSATRTVPLPPPSSSDRLPTLAQETVPLGAATALLDRLALADDAAFAAAWLEALRAAHGKLEPALAVRLLRAYRDTGRLDRARELAASLPVGSPDGWSAAEHARLSIERAALAAAAGRLAQADAELGTATRALTSPGIGAGRELLDYEVLRAQLEYKRGRFEEAKAALERAELAAERLEDGAWRASVEMTFGQLAMRLGAPGSAARHYSNALSRSPAHGAAAMTAHGNVALALATVGRGDEARAHARQSIFIAALLRAGWRHADAHDVLAIVELASDRPSDALAALEDAARTLGDTDQPTLRYQLAEHRTLALAALGRGEEAERELQQAVSLRARMGAVDAIDEQDLVVARARTSEAMGALERAVEIGEPHLARLPDAFVTGSLAVLVGRAALAQGDRKRARFCVELAARNAEEHGWVYPELALSCGLYREAAASQEPLVARFGERMLARASSRPKLEASSRELVDIVTRDGHVTIPYAEAPHACARYDVVLDACAHDLRVDARNTSLVRRRAVEPLLVRLMRAGDRGVTAAEIAGAEADGHRARVLVSRLRGLIGPQGLELAREDGAPARYKLAHGLRYALITPAQ